MTALVRYSHDLTPLLPSIFAKDPFFNSFFRRVHPEVRESMLDTFEMNTGINLYEENGKLMAEVTAPGFTKEQLKVSIEDDKLTVAAEQVDNQESKDRKHYYRGWSAQSFNRVLQLPYAVNPNAVNARYDNGILRLEMEKHQQQQAKTITIQ